MCFQCWKFQTHNFNVDNKKNFMLHTSTLRYLTKHDLMEILYGIHIPWDKGHMVLNFMQRSKTYIHVRSRYDYPSKRSLLIHWALSMKKMLQKSSQGNKIRTKRKGPLPFALVWPSASTKQKQKKCKNTSRFTQENQNDSLQKLPLLLPTKS